MKNITISMDEDLAEWVRVAAARNAKSVSRWIAERLGDLRREGADDDVAHTEAFLAGPKYGLSVAGRLPDREEIYGERFRGYERDPLHPRYEQPGQSGYGLGVAAEPGALTSDDDEPAGLE